MTDKTGVWGSLERWRSVAFVAAGVSFLAIAANFGAREVANTGMEVDPIVPMAFLVLVYAGLLGLSPALVERAPRSGRVSQILVLIFGADILLNFGAWFGPVSFARPVLALLVVTVMVGSALTLTVCGIVSIRTGAYSRPVGGFLLLAAVALYGGIASNLLFGTTSPEWVTAVYNGLLGISLVGVGYVLRVEDSPTDQADPAETVA